MCSTLPYPSRLTNLPCSKMESFIRSKYESRRWAMEGPIPSDPSVLEGASSSPPPDYQPTATPAGPSTQQPQQRQQPVAAPPVSTPTHVSSRSQGHQLLSSAYNARNQSPAPVAAPAPVQAAQQAPAAAVPASAAQDLFSLDFHAPSPSATPAGQAQQQQPKKDVKQDIMSLFSAPPASTPATASFGAFNAPAANVWGGNSVGAAQAIPQATATQAQPTSMMGAASWGASSTWGAPQVPQQPTFASNANVWGASAAAAPPAVPAGQASFFNTSDVWGSSGTAAPAAAPSNDLFGGFASSAAPAAPTKKDDVFGDIWGGFK